MPTGLKKRRYLLRTGTEIVMKTLTTRRIAITAVFIALLAVFSFTPLGMLPIIPGVIDTAFLLIMIVTLAAQLEGRAARHQWDRVP